MENKQKVMQVFDLCLQIQDSGYGDIFFRNYSHINQISVSGYKGGFSKNPVESFRYESYYSGQLTEWSNTNVMPLREIIILLTDILNNND